MEKKIFFTDLDGTLLNDKKEITPKTRDILAKIRNHGHYIVLISGRPLMSVLEARKELPISDQNLYLVASNGGMIFDVQNNTILKENRLTYEQTAFLLDYMEKAKIHCQTYKDDAVVAKKQTEELTFYQKTVHMPSIITNDIIAALDKPPLKCLAISFEREKLEKVKEELQPQIKDEVFMMFSNNRLLEMIPATSGKGTALKWLSEYLGVKIENTLAAGDQDNDSSMIETAGMGVAMINGSEMVKKVADRITLEDNNHDGLVPVLEEFFL